MKRWNFSLRGPDLIEPPDWPRWAIYRTTTWKTTWKLRLVLAALLVLLVAATRGWWGPAIGGGLVANSGPCKPDLIVVDNLVSDYELFEKAAALGKLAGPVMVLVPVRSSENDPEKPDPLKGEIVEVMIRQARLQSCTLLPFRLIEPFTLNVARQVGGFVKSHPEIHSVLVVTQALRSRRTRLVYARVLGKLGVAVYTSPVWKDGRPEAWNSTWHGRQDVMLQYLKLIYYELLLFPSRY